MNIYKKELTDELKFTRSNIHYNFSIANKIKATITTKSTNHTTLVIV